MSVVCARLARLAVVAGFLLACGPRHVAPFTPRERAYKPGAYAQSAARPTPGSLYSDAFPGYLEDTRALRVGDMVIIRIDESADASGASTTSLSKDTSAQAGTTAMLGIVPALKKAYPDIDPEKLLDYAAKSGFRGEGETARKGQLKASIGVRVTNQMPNGDLFLEGTKVVLVNNEEYHLYISGLVRPADIAPDNTVNSSRVTDAQIEFTGRGDIADQNRKGFFGRVLDGINPF